MKKMMSAVLAIAFAATVAPAAGADAPERLFLQ